MSSLEKFLFVLVAVVSLFALGTTLFFLLDKKEHTGEGDAAGERGTGESVEDPFSSSKVQKAGTRKMARPHQKSPLPPLSPKPRTSPENNNVPGKVFGKVLDEGGRAVEGVGIFLSFYQGSFFGIDKPADPRFETRTDPQGLFAFHDIPIGELYSLKASHEDYAPYELRRLQVLADEPTRIADITLKRGGGISGTVTDSANNPIQGARLVAASHPIFQADPFEYTGGVVTTDSRGYFIIPHLPPGNVVVYATAEGYSTDSKTDVRIEDGRINEEVNFQLSQGLSISGTVTDLLGKPLEGAHVYATPSGGKIPSIAKAATNQEGQYVLSGLGDKIYLINVSMKGYEKPKRSLPARGGSTNIDFQLEANGSISGTVYAEDTGKPVQSFQVSHGRKHTRGNKVLLAKRDSFENPDGSFLITDLDEGEHILKVRAKGYAPFITEPILVQKGQIFGGVVISLGHGGGIEGEVVDETSKRGVGGVLIQLCQEEEIFLPFLGLGEGEGGSDTKLTVRSSKNGSFRIENAGPGLYTLEVSHPSYAPYTLKEVAIDQGKTNNLGTIPLLVGGGIQGTVFKKDGNADPNAIVSIQGENFSKQLKTNSKGYYHIDKLPPGEYSVTCIQRESELNFLELLNSSAAKNKINVPNGETVEKNF